MSSFREEVEEMFKEMDKDGNGTIDQMEFASCLISNGYKLTPQKLKEAFTDIDNGGLGVITKEDFVTFMEDTMGDKAEEARLRRMFNHYDKDGNGCIDIFEMKELLRDFGFRLSDEEIKRITDDIDTDKSGTVELEEFVNAVYFLLNAD